LIGLCPEKDIKSFSVAKKSAKVSFLSDDGCVWKRGAYRVMIVSEKEEQQHEIV
jgi:hypothetical protein